MFTEQKRLEMDLEGLWEQRLIRKERKQQKRDDRLAKEDEESFETTSIESSLTGPMREDKQLSKLVR